MPISPLHVLLYQTFFFSKNVQIRFFSKYVDLYRSASFRSGFSMLQRSYTFLFFILRGIGELPNKRDWVHCIHTMYTNPLLVIYVFSSWYRFKSCFISYSASASSCRLSILYLDKNCVSDRIRCSFVRSSRYR